MTNVNLECEEYSKTQLLSDIGGAGKFGFFLLFQKWFEAENFSAYFSAGLMLGMSFASVIGIFEWIFTSLTTIIKARYVVMRQVRFIIVLWAINGENLPEFINVSALWRPFTDGP